LEELLGVQVVAGFVDELKQNLTLASEADAALTKRILDAFGRRVGAGSVALLGVSAFIEGITSGGRGAK
jgi:hypothetical protein